MPTCHKAHC